MEGLPSKQYIYLGDEEGNLDSEHITRGLIQKNMPLNIFANFVLDVWSREKALKSVFEVVIV